MSMLNEVSYLLLLDFLMFLGLLGTVVNFVPDVTLKNMEQ